MSVFSAAAATAMSCILLCIIMAEVSMLGEIASDQFLVAGKTMALSMALFHHWVGTQQDSMKRCTCNAVLAT